MTEERSVVLGVIADDFTGATDVASMLVRGGMRTVQAIGVPEGAAPHADAVVVALKSRSLPAAEAVSQSLAALRWPVARGPLGWSHRSGAKDSPSDPPAGLRRGERALLAVETGRSLFFPNDTIHVAGWGGIAINGTPAATVTGNYIGVGADGVTALGNGIGVYLFNATAGSRIGGTAAGEGNLIGYNATGIAVQSAGSQAAILGNRYVANSGQTIDLGWDGVALANDTGDGDTGANGLQNFPVFVLARSDGSSLLSLTGSFNSLASTAFRVEFYATPVNAVPSVYDFPSNPFLTKWQYAFNTKTDMVSLSDQVTINPKLTLNLGVKSLTSKINADLQQGSGMPSGSIKASKQFLPQLGMAYQLSPRNELFAAYTENMRAFQGAATGTTPFATSDVGFNAIKDKLKPETSTTMEAGWRHTSSALQATLTG